MITEKMIIGKTRDEKLRQGENKKNKGMKYERIK